MIEEEFETERVMDLITSRLSNRVVMVTVSDEIEQIWRAIALNIYNSPMKSRGRTFKKVMQDNRRGLVVEYAFCIALGIPYVPKVYDFSHTHDFIFMKKRIELKSIEWKYATRPDLHVPQSSLKHLINTGSSETDFLVFGTIIDADGNSPPKKEYAVYFPWWFDSKFFMRDAAGAILYNESDKAKYSGAAHFPLSEGVYYSRDSEAASNPRNCGYNDGERFSEYRKRKYQGIDSSVAGMHRLTAEEEPRLSEPALDSETS